MRSIPDIVKQLIIINVLFFVGTFLISPDITGLVTDLLALHYPGNYRFGIWQLLTHMFMHGGFSHILFNMFGLWMFGSPLAQMWGKNKFLFFYISAGLGAALVQLTVNYAQVSAIIEQLVSAGFSESTVLDLLQSERYSTAWQSVISESQLNSLYTSFNFSMVGASWFAFFQNRFYRMGMVFHIKPVTCVVSIAINGNGFTIYNGLNANRLF